jgi:hypothetical protein
MIKPLQVRGNLVGYSSTNHGQRTKYRTPRYLLSSMAPSFESYKSMCPAYSPAWTLLTNLTRLRVQQAEKERHQFHRIPDDLKGPEQI